LQSTNEQNLKFIALVIPQSPMLLVVKYMENDQQLGSAQMQGDHLLKGTNRDG